MQAIRSNLPHALSSFIGRKREMAEVRQLLRTERLITLTGVGGSGKTRLALQTAANALPSFEDGIWLTELASLADEELVPQAVASVLDVHEQGSRPMVRTLAESLESRQLLLILDNCEHLILACARMAEFLLQACPSLTILTTSREPLGIAGEVVRIIPPLSLPATAKAGSDSEAVELFVTRAQAAVPGFELSPENAEAVAEICLRLDGMPLAIELAAARLRALSVQQVRALLGDRFQLLTGGSRTAPARQRTLEATLDWSYALLTDPEQQVLQRLSVFAGGCTLEAAGFVCEPGAAGSAGVMDLLARLVDKNLVTADRSYPADVRYHLLETIRQYSLKQLAASGGLEATRDRHLDYFLQWAQQAEAQLDGPESLAWLKRFEEEHDNLRAALERSLTAASRSETGLQLAAVTARFWKLHGHHHEGRSRLEAALAQEGVQEPSLARALALWHASVLAFYQSDYPTARAHAMEALEVCQQLEPRGREVAADALEMLAEVATETGDYAAATQHYTESLELSRESGYLKGIGENLKMLGWLTMRTGSFETAKSMMEEALHVCRQSGDLHQIASALAGLGELAIRQGEYGRARDLLEEALGLAQSLGEKWGLGIALGSLGWLALRHEDFDEMRRLLEESLAVRMDSGDRGGTAWCLERLAEASSLQGRHLSAATILGAASALRADASAVMDAADRPDHERRVSGLRAELGEEVFAEAWTKGEALPLSQVVAFALAEAGPAGTGQRVDKERYGGLTARERQTATLIAQGKSNREIAEAMTVGVKTVETYVTRILGKLGLQSRVQIATWAIANELAPSPEKE